MLLWHVVILCCDMQSLPACSRLPAHPNHSAIGRLEKVFYRNCSNQRSISAMLASALVILVVVATGLLWRGNMWRCTEQYTRLCSSVASFSLAPALQGPSGASLEHSKKSDGNPKKCRSGTLPPEKNCLQYNSLCWYLPVVALCMMRMRPFVLPAKLWWGRLLLFSRTWLKQEGTSKHNALCREMLT